MVQVQSNRFLLDERNLQKLVENISKAAERDYQSAARRIYRSAEYPSHISVSVPAR